MTPPFTKEQEIWIIKRSALMMPTQLQSFINQFLDLKKSHHLAPRPFAFTCANNTAGNDQQIYSKSKEEMQGLPDRIWWTF